jgi:hypothetical protein
MRLTTGGIIDIIQFDENAKRSIRRVRVAILRPDGDFCQIVGVNLKGEYPKDYRLPIESAAGRPPAIADSAAWKPFVPDEEFDH